MIAGIRGTLEAIAHNYAVVSVGGVSLKVFVPLPTLHELGSIGDPVRLFTHLYLREDNLALYGFATREELEMFELLLTVSGVGPRSALAILSAAPLASLREAIEAGDMELLTRVPGIGRKTAGRLILELKGKVVVGVPAAASADNEVVDALVNLGYTLSDARAALRSLPTDTALTTEEKILLALRYFAKR